MQTSSEVSWGLVSCLIRLTPNAGSVETERQTTEVFNFQDGHGSFMEKQAMANNHTPLSLYGLYGDTCFYVWRNLISLKYALICFTVYLVIIAGKSKITF